MDINYENLLKSLTDLGFEKAGSFSLKDAVLSLGLDSSYAEQEELLYCFVENDLPVYVGKTVKPLKERMRQYRRGDRSQKTNHRINKKIVEALQHDKKIEIYVLTFSEQHTHHGFHLNLAAGIEDSVIKHVDDTLKSCAKKSWNKAGTTG
jgi:hypothetical protein